MNKINNIPFDEDEEKFLINYIGDNHKGFKTLYDLSDFVKLYKAFKKLREKSSGIIAYILKLGQNKLGQRFGENLYNTINKQNPDVVEKFATMLQIYRNNNNDDSFEGYQKFVISIIDILAVSAKQQITKLNISTRIGKETLVKLINQFSSDIKIILGGKGSFILKAVYDNTPNTIIGQARISPDASEQPGGGRRFNKTRRKKQNKKRKRKYSKKR